MTASVTARNRRNKANGARWESAVRDCFRRHGFEYDCSRMTGKHDEGDGVIRMPEGGRIVVEAKSGKMLAADFVRQAEAEARNYETHRDLAEMDTVGIAIVKRAGKPVEEAYVLTTVRELFALKGGK